MLVFFALSYLPLDTKPTRGICAAIHGKKITSPSPNLDGYQATSSSRVCTVSWARKFRFLVMS